MRKTRVLAVALGLVLLGGAMTAHAAQSQNVGARAYLAWSTTDTTAIEKNDVDVNSTPNLYVIFRQDPANGNGTGLDFAGAEIDLIWSANVSIDAGLACFEHSGTTYKTSAGTTCTYLNRGSAVPVTTADDPGHLHVAWANSSNLTNCTQGVGIVLQFDFSGCADPTMSRGTFQLTEVKLIDKDKVLVDSSGNGGGMSIGGAVAYVNRDTPVLPTSWGSIKRQFGH